MKKAIELEQSIIAILKKIRDDFPELMKYINETPLSKISSNSLIITKKELEAYSNSLYEIYSNYSTTHSA